MSMHALVEKWLRDAEYLISVDRGDKADGISACAEQLMAALAGGGEAVARFRIISRGPVAPDMEFDWLAEPLDIGSNEWTPLFPHPAGAVQVNETVPDVAWDRMLRCVMLGRGLVEGEPSRYEPLYRRNVKPTRTVKCNGTCYRSDYGFCDEHNPSLNPGGSRE